MNIKPLWVMQIPVISTDHMPHTNALKELEHFNALCAIYDEGGFVYLPDDPFPEGMWTGPIKVWLQDHFGEDASWVRFDCDGDVVEGLPVFDWSSTCATTA